MNQKDLYKQKYHAQLDEWKADIAKLKAKASGASADAQTEMNRQVGELEHKMERTRTKFSELAGTGEDAWDSFSRGVNSAWGSLKSAVRDAASRFKG